MTDIQESDLAVRPTIFITIDEFGEPNFGTNAPEMELIDGIGLLELTKQKMIALYYRNIAQEKQKAALTKPQIVVPTGQINLR